MTEATATMRYRQIDLSNPHNPDANPTTASVSAFPLPLYAQASLLLGVKGGAASFSLHVTPNGARELAALLIEQADHADPPASDGTTSHGPTCAYRMTNGLAGCDCRPAEGFTTCATCGRPLGGGQTHEPTCEARDEETRTADGALLRGGALVYDNGDR